jgi:Raf kinase inhibitor-like YbhB/YbcL family protein
MFCSMPSRILTSILVLLGASFCLASKSWAQPAMELESPAFAAGATIPTEYTCSGADKSPPLLWKGVPAGTATLALIVDDPDAPAGTWVHWVLYDLPASQSELAQGIARSATLESGARQGINSFGKVGYNGPCPPPGSPHHYHFRLYALDGKLDLPARATAADLEAAAGSHTAARAELVGTFGR